MCARLPSRVKMSHKLPRKTTQEKNARTIKRTRAGKEPMHHQIKRFGTRIEKTNKYFGFRVLVGVSYQNTVYGMITPRPY